MTNKADDNLDWRWIEGTVDTENEHIAIIYGDNDEVIALVAPAQEKTFVVEFKVKKKSDDPELQKIIVDALVETEEMLFEETPLAVEQQIKDLEAQGVEFIYLDKSEIARWAAAIQPLYDEYAQKYGAEWEQFLKVREPMR